MSSITYHTPVLLQEAIEGLNLREGGVYVDATYGGGGHTKKILDLLRDCVVIAFDQDPEAIHNVPSDEKRLIFIPQNFRYLRNYLRHYHYEKVDGILADLGVSSYQLDTPERGFSFRFDALLDMRMDRQGDDTARRFIHLASQEELKKIFTQYGELRNASRLAKAIVNARQQHAIQTTADLIKALEQEVPGNKLKAFLPQIFQAIRIHVNDELGALRELLQQSVQCLQQGGRLVIISYHSLEDRMVKNFMRYGNIEGIPQKDFYGNLLSFFTMLTRKPIVPSEKEIAKNPRARSAKLRIAEKL